MKTTSGCTAQTWVQLRRGAGKPYLGSCVALCWLQPSEQAAQSLQAPQQQACSAAERLVQARTGERGARKPLRCCNALNCTPCVVARRQQAVHCSV